MFLDKFWISYTIARRVPSPTTSFPADREGVKGRKLSQKNTVGHKPPTPWATTLPYGPHNLSRGPHYPHGPPNPTQRPHNPPSSPPKK